MKPRRPIRTIAVALAVLTLLLLATTLGSVWHHHSAASDATCPICHLNHQQVQRPVAVSRAPVLAVVRSSQEAASPVVAPAPVIRILPARAPPSA